MLNRYRQFIKESLDKQTEIDKIILFLSTIDKCPIDCLDDMKNTFIKYNMSGVSATLELVRKGFVKPTSRSIVNDLNNCDSDTLYNLYNELNAVNKKYFVVNKLRYDKFVEYVLHESTSIGDTLDRKPNIRHGFYNDDIDRPITLY